MKKLFNSLLILITATGFNNAFAQNSELKKNNLHVSLRSGYDFPTYNNNTPYVTYKGGVEFGASIDYYWSWYGIGVGFDQIQNKPKNNYPILNLIDTDKVTPLTDLLVSENNSNRFFYGIGPNFRYITKNGKFTAELNTRAGFASVKGGRTLVTDVANARALNFHAGYSQNQVFSAKGQIRFTYNIIENIGIQLGGYYLNHFKTQELLESGVAAGHEPFTTTGTNHTLSGTGAIVRTTPLKTSISSIGIFAGVTFKILSKEKKKKEEKNYMLVITAKDKYTKTLLPETTIAVKDLSGNIVKTGVTNALGVILFENLKPDNYTIEGVLYEIELEKNTILKSEFNENNGLRKEILYTDTQFILKGKTVKCNTSIPLTNVSVLLKNKEQSTRKSTITGSQGKFILRVKQNSNYSIYGKKEQFFSQTENITTGEYDRQTTLFVQLEMCMEKAECGTPIQLRNIHYDVDTYSVREIAKQELNRLVQFMIDNPTMHVEVSSHTDASATHAYNQKLSQKRANAAVAYIVSQGISQSRLTGTGYGETKLINECADGVPCSEYKQQMNRRTEMKVICSK